MAGWHKTSRHQRDYRTPEAAAARRLYATRRWKALRLVILQRDHYTCTWPGCGTLLIGTHTAPDAPIVHHIKDHKGDPILFFDPCNLMAICKEHHDRDAQRATHRGHISGNGPDGRPLDPSHPWNQGTQP